MTTHRPETAPPTGRAWTDDDIAWFLACSQRHVATLRDQDPTFPEPVGGLGKIVRWRPRDVIAWFDNKAGDPVEVTWGRPPVEPVPSGAGGRRG